MCNKRLRYISSSECYIFPLSHAADPLNSFCEHIGSRNRLSSYVDECRRALNTCVIEYIDELIIIWFDNFVTDGPCYIDQRFIILAIQW